MQTASPELHSADVLRWAENLYQQHVDNKDAVGFAAAFTEDGWLRFANAPVIRGREAIRVAIEQFFSSFVDLRHTSRGAWLVDDTLFLEATVTYTRHDKRQVSVPAMTVFRIAGAIEGQHGEPPRPVADECRIYVDLTPLYAPVAE